MGVEAQVAMACARLQKASLSPSATSPTQSARPARPLTKAERATLLSTVTTAWSVNADREALQRSFEFKDFNATWAFMSRVAALAEELDHQPVWSNEFNCVDVTLRTQDCKGLSDKDVTMAVKMNEFAAALQ